MSDPAGQRVFGKDLGSHEHWEEVATEYSSDLAGSRVEYHGGRLATAESLLDRADLGEGAAILDFGCGDSAFTVRLGELGFEEGDQPFFNLHPQPPALLGSGGEGRIFDPAEIARVPTWKQAFQSSAYFSLSRRI